MAKYNKQTFTLLEVVMALAIMALGFISAMGLAMNAASRLMKSQTRWEEQHMLNQAAEYYLLAGPKEQIPQEFFPYEGYHAECVIEKADLPEGVDAEVGTWRLVKLIITIYNQQNQPVNSLEMDKILQAADVE